MKEREREKKDMVRQTVSVWELKVRVELKARRGSRLTKAKEQPATRIFASSRDLRWKSTLGR